MTNKDFDTCPGGNIGSFPPQGAMFYPAILSQDQIPDTKRHAVSKNHDGDGEHHEGDDDHSEEEEEEEKEDGTFVGKRLHHHKRGSKKSKRSVHARDGDEHHDGDEHSEEDDDHTEALPAVAPLMTSRCSHVITVTKPRVSFLFPISCLVQLDERTMDAERSSNVNAND